MKKNAVRYSLFENIRYVVAGINKWQPAILPLMVLHGITAGLSTFVWLYAVKWIIEIFQKEGAVTDKVQQVLILVIAASVIELIMLVFSNLSEKGSEGRMHDVEYRFALFWVTKVWTMPYPMHENPEMQNAIFKARRAINSNDNGVAGFQYWGNQVFPLALKAVTALVLLCFVNPIIVLLIIIISYIRFDLINRASIYEKEVCENQVAKEQMASDKYYTDTADFAFGKDIRLFRMQGPLYRLLQRYTNLLNEQAGVAQKRYARNYVLGDVLELIQEIATYGLLIYMVLTAKMSVADFTLYLGSAHSAATALNEIFGKIIRINKESLHINDFRDFIESDENGVPEAKSDFKKDYQTCEDAYKQSETVKWDKNAGYKFEFDHVSFKYPGSDSYALKDMSITLNAGEKLAVVGLNGAGKTTFVKLLCRLYEPAEGHIYLNGKDISEYELNDYWELIAPVFQEDESFAFSIAQNVAMKDKDGQDREWIEKALLEADLMEKVQQLPKGMNTYLYKNLEDDGTEFSGGQKQKLMLARALYKAAPVIVLDEPTAALDAIAEAKSYENFNSMAGGKTCVYISHRLSSTKFCDAIAMFEDGQLVEYGSHDTLMEKQGKYAELFRIQAQYYTEEGK